MKVPTGCNVVETEREAWALERQHSRAGQLWGCHEACYPMRHEIIFLFLPPE